METVSRKRKGAPPVCSATRSLQDLASRKRAYRGSEPQQSHCTDAPVPAVVMTAPAASGASASARVLPGRGLKRKVGCIDNATRIGWRKRLESEYDLGDEIGHGKFGFVRVCRPKAGTRGEEEFACKALPKNGGDTTHREVEIMQHLSGHPGVVTLSAVFEDTDAFYLVVSPTSPQWEIPILHAPARAMEPVSRKRKGAPPVSATSGGERVLLQCSVGYGGAVVVALAQIHHQDSSERGQVNGDGIRQQHARDRALLQGGTQNGELLVMDSMNSNIYRMALPLSQCAFAAYDYSGYGASTGKPSEENTYADIEAVPGS
uniref:Protein kinase domain-containing protein n=1 Tax=Zea mays TaxID=4577 RepID=A0A804Q8Y8_MAIZE